MRWARYTGIVENRFSTKATTFTTGSSVGR
jgi:hypothetical protein